MPDLQISTLGRELGNCGYCPSLLIRDFPFGSPEGPGPIPLAAFADEPADAASACIAVIRYQEGLKERVRAYRDFGAPVVFVLDRDRFHWWRQGADCPQHLESLGAAEVPGFFREHRAELAPEAIYRAKVRGRFEHGYQLSFVDSGLMPLVETEIGRHLSELVERLIAEVRQALGRRQLPAADAWCLLRSVFWLVAARILADKRVQGFEGLDLNDVDAVFSKVGAHYGAEDGGILLTARLRRSLEGAAKSVGRFASLGHVTPESLAAVYETALVSKQTRRAFGTHSTPGYLAQYVAWRLAPWIEQLPAADRHVLEPTCGQGTFLVAAMRVLRSLLPSGENRPAYLRQHLHGIDVDAFAVELARLSLTLADIPHPDGWDLRCADVLAPGILERAARRSGVVVGNPPFQHFTRRERNALTEAGSGAVPGSKAAEVLRRTLRHLRPGGVFGFVAPLGIIEAKQATDLRSLLVEEFEIAEITLLPEGLFSFSEAEAVLLLGRRLPAAERPDRQVRYTRVRRGDLDQFRSSYAVSSDRRISQRRFAAAPGFGFLLPDLEDVWHECRSLPRLADIAEVGRGIEYENAAKLPADTKTVSSKRFPGARRGYARFAKDQYLHQPPPAAWLNLDPEVIRRSGSGPTEGIAQVLINPLRTSRGPWRLKAVVDPEGRPVQDQLLSVRPRQDRISILSLWAILNSPLANAFLFTHSRGVKNLNRTIRAIPVPIASGPAIVGLDRRVERYLAAARGEGRPPPAPAVEEEPIAELLLAVDAELLRLYDLPPRLERQLLDLFAGWPRSGISFTFNRYFPADFRPCFPLHRYLSPGLRASTAGELRRRWSPAPEIVRKALAAADGAFPD